MYFFYKRYKIKRKRYTSREVWYWNKHDLFMFLSIYRQRPKISINFYKFIDIVFTNLITVLFKFYYKIKSFQYSLISLRVTFTFVLTIKPPIMVNKIIMSGFYIYFFFSIRIWDTCNETKNTGFRRLLSFVKIIAFWPPRIRYFPENYSINIAKNQFIRITICRLLQLQDQSVLFCPPCF